VIFALHPLNLTTVTPLAAIKFVPLILTPGPHRSARGREARDRRVGITAKLFVLVAVPPGVVTLSGPSWPRRHRRLNRCR